VELLVVLVIALIVSGVAFSVYRVNASYYYKEDAYLQLYQNLRVALYTVSRDVRMAGNGFSVLNTGNKRIDVFSPTRETLTGISPPTATNVTPALFSHADAEPGKTGARGIFGVDGGDNDPDSLTIFRAELETGSYLGHLDGDPSGNVVTIDKDVDPKALLPGDIIALSNGERAMVLEVDPSYTPGERDIPIKTGGRFTPVTLPTDFPYNGASLYNFRDIVFVTYYVDQGSNTLMADYHDNSRTLYDDAARKSVVVSGNIEDLEVYYFFSNNSIDMTTVSSDPAISSAHLDGEDVNAVAIGMTAIAPYGEGANNKVRPALFNRHAGVVKDNRQRSTLVQTINLRNY
jgi:hypothetical protein